MPRPRFSKLGAEKQAVILESAAREFAMHGFDGASLNRILEQAQLSKGAAYYYFDDKADLFATTVLHYAGDLIGSLSEMAAGLTAANFWSTFADQYAAQFEYFADKPWAFGAIKAAGRLSQRELEENPALMASLGEVQQGVITLLGRGQELGVVRTDLPLALLAALFIAVDDANDRWVLAQWDSLSTEELKQTVGCVVEGLSRMLGVQ